MELTSVVVVCMCVGVIVGMLLMFAVCVLMLQYVWTKERDALHEIVQYLGRHSNNNNNNRHLVLRMRQSMHGGGGNGA